MSRVKSGVVTHARHRKVIKQAAGYYSARSRNFRTATQAVDKANQYATRDRKARKRNFRSLWIQRINAAARIEGFTYSQFIHGLGEAGIEIADAVRQHHPARSAVADMHEALGAGNFRHQRLDAKARRAIEGWGQRQMVRLEGQRHRAIADRGELGGNRQPAAPARGAIGQREFIAVFHRLDRVERRIGKGSGGDQVLRVAVD